MFNEKKIQLEICKALSNGNLNESYAVCDEGHIVVTYDNNSAFIISRENLIFNIKLLKHAELLRIIARADELYPLTPTDRLTKINGALCRKFEYGTQIVYAQEKYVELFKDYQLYISEEHHAIIAKTQGDAVIGFFMQMYK